MYYVVETDKSFEQAAADLEAAVTRHGFGVLHVHDLGQTLRSKGYNAYIRSFDGMNRVFVGPVIERAEADRLRDQLNRQQKLNGFVVRFQPENG